GSVTDFSHPRHPRFACGYAHAFGRAEEPVFLSYPALTPQRVERASATYRATIFRRCRDWYVEVRRQHRRPQRRNFPLVLASPRLRVSAVRGTAVEAAERCSSRGS